MGRFLTESGSALSVRRCCNWTQNLGPDVEVVVHFPILLNVLGHVTGMTAFIAFLFLLFRGARGAIRAPAAAAGLAVCWNLGSLIVLLADPGSRVQEVVAALSFAVLSLLPCTLLHLALRGEHRWLSWAGYAVGCGAALVHVSNAFGFGRATQETGIASINYGFSALAVVAAVLLARGGSGHRVAGMRTLAAMALFLLAASFVHFGRVHAPGAWLHELVFHHAGIPLALFVLLLDYRFLLLDVFVRLAGAGLLAAAFAGALLWLMDALGLLQSVEATAIGLAAFLVAASLVILAYPPVLARLGLWVQNALFRRQDVRNAARDIRALSSTGERAFLERASELIAGFVSAKRWTLLETGLAQDIARVEIAPAPYFEALAESGRRWAEAAVPLRDRTGASRVLLLGARQGGRRFLSGDVTDLEQLAGEVASRIERMRRQEQENLLRDAEMATLRAQINPHFLFNALNALNGIIPQAATDARRTLLNLADIFRYSLDSKRQFVSLEEEMRIVEAYLQIERLRLGDRLTTRIELDDRVRRRKVPALSIQPLVENAVKHGVSSRPQGGEVRVLARQEHGALHIEVSDDGEGFDPHLQSSTGHGLRSVERRLHLCYGEAVEFRVDADGAGSTVGFRVPLQVL